MDEFDKMLFEMAESESVDAPEGLKARVRGALAGLPERRAVTGRTARAAICALAAAALAGTALAVFSAGGFKSVELGGGDEPEYSVEGGEYVFVPVEELSDEVRRAARENPVADTTKYFQGRSWEAAQEYSGVTLPGNEVLDGMDLGNSYLTVSANDLGPTCLRFWQGSSGRLWLSMSAEVYTELMRTDGMYVDRKFPSGLELTAEEYTAENGLSALIVHLMAGDAEPEGDGEIVDTERYMADFLLEGVRFHIKVEVDGETVVDGDEAYETLCEILDGFEV